MMTGLLIIIIIQGMNYWEIEFAFGDIFTEALRFRMLEQAKITKWFLLSIVSIWRIPSPTPNCNNLHVYDSIMPIMQTAEIGLRRCHWIIASDERLTWTGRQFSESSFACRRTRLGEWNCHANKCPCPALDEFPRLVPCKFYLPVYSNPKLLLAKSTRQQFEKKKILHPHVLNGRVFLMLRNIHSR